MLKTKDLIDLTHTLAAPILEDKEYPWEALPLIKEFILKLGPTLDPEVYENKGEGIWIAKSAKVFDSAYIAGPCIIGPETEVRQCAFIRGSALIGSKCVIGNSTELKNVIISDNVQVPHYNYVGDSILGFKSHLGAGAITSNVKSDKTLVSVKCGDEVIETGLKKFAAIVGDNVEVGCQSVLNPGTVIGRGSRVYPLSRVRGVIPEKHIFKDKDDIVPIED